MLTLKLFAALLIFIAGLTGGWLSLYASRKTRYWQRLLFFGEYVARGIFLGIALLHMLPEAQYIWQQQFAGNSYPVIFLIATLTLFAVQLIDQTSICLAARHVAARHWLPYLLLILLSIHSIIAGVALGSGASASHVIILLAAIIAHKSAAAFALGINMHKHELQRSRIQWLTVLFSLMTPLGILASASIHLATTAEAVFSAIAAGTFLYIAILQYKAARSTTLAFGSGIALMAILALYV